MHPQVIFHCHSKKIHICSHLNKQKKKQSVKKSSLCYCIFGLVDKVCTNDIECPSEKACIQNICSDPCTLRGACGENALCKTVLHMPRCSCPNCYIGRPGVECKPDPNCDITTTPRPAHPMYLPTPCQKDTDCHETLRCDTNGICVDPCEAPKYICEGNKKCEPRRHRPVCVCKSGFMVNELGELTCAPDKRECTRNDECGSNMACIDLKCQNPCVATATRLAPCPADKACQVQDHKPVCICMKDCSPSISICLRDSGCPIGLACRNYQCINPCDIASCAANSPCFVEDHKPICKFCPPGFIADSRNGCQKGKAYVRRFKRDILEYRTSLKPLLVSRLLF